MDLALMALMPATPIYLLGTASALARVAARLTAAAFIPYFAVYGPMSLRPRAGR